MKNLHFQSADVAKDYKLSKEWYYNYLVTEGKQKYVNPIDRLLGIKNSKNTDGTVLLLKYSLIYLVLV